MGKRAFVWIVLIFMILSCDKGLEPPTVRTGFGGTVTFQQGTWPSVPDSITSLLVVASQVFPLDSASVYNGLLANPPYVFLETLLEGTAAAVPHDSVNYEVTVPPTTYYYIGVIQRIGQSLSISNLRVVGLYVDSLSQRKVLTVGEEEFIQGVNMHADFYNPPPQPF